MKSFGSISFSRFCYVHPSNLLGVQKKTEKVEEKKCEHRIVNNVS